MGTHEPGKFEAAADRIASIYHTNADTIYGDDPEPGALQIVFMDMGTPKGSRLTKAEREEQGLSETSVDDDADVFGAYDHMKAELVQRGIPEEKIRFIHEAKNDAEKAELFAAAKARPDRGPVRFQREDGRRHQRAAAHEGSAPHRRAVAARRRRAARRPGHRQGNLHMDMGEDFEIHRYVTEGSFDAYMWQTLERKAKFINQIMRGSLDVREIEDVGDTAMSYAEVKALALGNPDFLHKAKADTQVQKLARLQRSHARTQTNLAAESRRLTDQAENQERISVQYTEALDRLTDLPLMQTETGAKGEERRFLMQVGTEEFTASMGSSGRTEAGAALRQAIVDYAGRNRYGAREEPIATYRGQTITAKGRVSVGGENVIGLRIAGIDYEFANFFASDLKEGAGRGIVARIENMTNSLESRRDDMIANAAANRAEVARMQDRVGKTFAQEHALDAWRKRAERLDAKIKRDDAREQGRDIPYDPHIDSDDFDDPLTKGSAETFVPPPEQAPARMEVLPSSLGTGNWIEYVKSEVTGETSVGEVVSFRTAAGMTFVTIRNPDGSEVMRAYTADSVVVRVGSPVEAAVTGVKRMLLTRVLVKCLDGTVRVQMKVGKFDESEHPRDRRGRFIETGAEVRIWGGGLGKILGTLPGGRVRVARADGKTVVVDAGNVTVTKTPQGVNVDKPDSPNVPGTADAPKPPSAAGTTGSGTTPAPDATPDDAVSTFTGPNGERAWLNVENGDPVGYMQDGEDAEPVKYTDPKAWASAVDEKGWAEDADGGSADSARQMAADDAATPSTGRYDDSHEAPAWTSDAEEDDDYEDDLDNLPKKPKADAPFKAPANGGPPPEVLDAIPAGQIGAITTDDDTYNGTLTRTATGVRVEDVNSTGETVEIPTEKIVGYEEGQGDRVIGGGPRKPAAEAPPPGAPEVDAPADQGDTPRREPKPLPVPTEPYDKSDNSTTPVSEYGMDFDPANLEIPEVAAAKADDGMWEDAPLVDYPLGNVLHATEEALTTRHITKIQQGEALREGYDPFILRLDSGDYVIDGHHRVGMHAALGNSTMPARVIDQRTTKPTVTPAHAPGGDVDITALTPGELQALDDTAIANALRTAPAADMAGRLREELTRRANIRAKALMRSAEADEPEVTNALTSIAGKFGGKMEGLNNRLKAEDSLTRKIRDKALLKGLTQDESAAAINDALRYTMTLDADEYSEAVQAVLDEFATLGYEQVAADNSWGRGQIYQGINSTYRTPDGTQFEVQFHTPESFVAKGKTHADYEISRDPTAPLADRQAAHDRMVALQESNPIPPGVEEVGNIKAGVPRPTPATPSEFRQVEIAKIKGTAKALEGIDIGSAKPITGVDLTAPLHEALLADFAGGSAEGHLVDGPNGKTFSPERAELHQRIVAHMLDGFASEETPRYNVMGGGSGAGKSSMEAARPEISEGNAVINPDDIKAMLPEYLPSVENSDPMGSTFVHEESSYLAKMVQAEAFKRKVSVTLDGTGDSSAAKMIGKIEAARAAGYAVNGYYVTVPTDVAVARVNARAAKTGRAVPETVVRMNHANVSAIFEQIAPSFDSMVLYDANAPLGSDGGPAVVAVSPPGTKGLQIVDQDLWAGFLSKADESMENRAVEPFTEPKPAGRGSEANTNEPPERALTGAAADRTDPSSMSTVQIEATIAAIEARGASEDGDEEYLRALRDMLESR